MAGESAEGVILKKYLLRETSYALVVFTREFGKIRGVIKGVRNPYPQFAGDYEIFTRCAFLLYRKKRGQMDLITQCDGIEPFVSVRKDIERLTYANYIIELMDTVTNDHDANEGLYNILLESLRMLDTGASAKRTARIFELKLLEDLGLSPRLTECAACESSVGANAFFSAGHGGALCERCARSARDRVSVSQGTLKFMEKIRSSEFALTARIKVSREVGKETEEVLRQFLNYHIGRPLKSLAFLGQLRKAGIAR
jgi:DNA repair protein RecO (recombination protein O)